MAHRNSPWYQKWREQKRELTELVLAGDGKPVAVEDGRVFIGRWSNCKRGSRYICPYCESDYHSTHGLSRHVRDAHHLEIDAHGWLRETKHEEPLPIGPDGLPVVETNHRDQEAIDAEVGARGLPCCGKRRLPDGRIAYLLR